MNNEEDNTNRKLFVGNISWNLNFQDLKDFFSEYGEVEFVKIVKDHDTGRSKGFGFVTFANEEDAAKALEDADGKELDGRELRVQKAQPKEGGSAPMADDAMAA